MFQGVNLGSTQQMPVELQVANLDQNIDAREMKRILFTVFRDHVMVRKLYGIVCDIIYLDRIFSSFL